MALGRPILATITTPVTRGAGFAIDHRDDGAFMNALDQLNGRLVDHRIEDRIVAGRRLGSCWTPAACICCTNSSPPVPFFCRTAAAGTPWPGVSTTRHRFHGAAHAER
jgi:hypothetical protein